MEVHWVRRSLVFRLVGMSLLLLLLVQAAGFAVVRESIDQNARRQIVSELDVDENVWRRLLERNGDRLQQGAALLAADYGFRSAVGSDEEETIQSGLENHGARIGAAVTAWLAVDMSVKAISASNSGSDFRLAVAEVATSLERGGIGSQIAVVNGAPYQFVLVPLKAPVLMGWVLMGFPLGQPLADEMRQLMKGHVVITVRTPQGHVLVPVSTLKEADFVGWEDALARASRTELDVPSMGRMLVRTMTLGSKSDEGTVWLLRSFDDVVAPYQKLQLLLGVITVGGIVLFAVGSGLVARRVTEPLWALTAAMRKLSEGNYETPVGSHLQRHDEIGQLARSFDRMRKDIGAQQAEIRRLAYWDRLTGLPNRESFRGSVVRAMADMGALPDGQLAVLTLDLDRFKHVNDVLGYALGDQVLQLVAQRLGAVAGAQSAMLARLGGNEFAILLQGGGESQARALAQAILKALEAPLALTDQTVDVNAGIGMACWPVDATDADTLLSRCEIAMYAAKRSLSGMLRYAASLDSSSVETLSLLSELRHAVEHDELRLYLQPKIALDGVGPVRAEALVRWEHPQRGLVSPMRFIPFAEQTGFVRRITLWMLEAVARFLNAPQVRSLPLGLQVSVNLSARDLMDPDLSGRLTSILDRHGVRAESFCLEITESAIMDDPLKAEAMLNRLAELGFKLSIDDFGTGYSSLAYLKRLPVQELKIDQSFVMGMDKDADDAVIVRSTIELAHNLGLTVVAEGVESAELLMHLRSLGCDEAQGYHISRPLAQTDFVHWVSRGLPSPSN